ncbi:MAG: acetylornithine/succinylornithine family transaminase [Anaerolineae bacterium]|nr:acetylornithine/succinylornithine family transaminase [Anaerolineae bacterium]
MSSSNAQIIALESRYTSGAYPKREVAIVRGAGARLWDADGREYIDCASGQGVALLGHGRLEVATAIAEQARRLITCPEIFYNDQRARLLERLIGLAPAGLTRAFLCNSGAEAIEGAIKFARLATGRPGIVAAMRGFHGRTMGALSATWEEKYRQPFEPLVPGFIHVPYNNLERLAQSVTSETAAVLLEVIQGEGGVRPGAREFLQGARELCDRAGALLIVDEVQTGFGRTGRWFAVQHHDLRPDLMALAKGIAGGVPMGAVLMTEAVADKITPGVHGSTFGGNPLACAAALATLDVIEKEDLPRQAAEKGEYFIGRLRRLESPKVREVRGLGLLVGVELRERATPYLQALMRRGVLALPAGPTVVRFLPPLVISLHELDQVADAFAAVLNAL